jgi:hypothetical protein
MARRRAEEFYCNKGGGGCGKYFITWLRDDMWGNYDVECPNPSCKHHHHRVIKEGLVTDERHSVAMGKSTVLMSMPSTLRDTPYHDDPDYRRSLLKLTMEAQDDRSTKDETRSRDSVLADGC